MLKRLVSGIMLTLLLTGMVTLAFHFKPIEAESSSQQCPSGMISYWKFDEGEGVTAYDSAGANDGTLVNGPVWTTGKVDGALNFDGVDDFVGLDDNPSLDITNKITMEAWINIDSFPTDEMQVLCKGRYDFWRWGISVLRPTKVRALLRTGEIDFFDSNAVLSIGVWHHVAVTYNGSAKIIYVDGNEEGSVSAGGNISTDNYPLYIGNRYDKAEVDFNGTIDEVAIYNRALTPEEIQQHYEKGLMGLGYCGVDWWPMFSHDRNRTGYSTSTGPKTNNTIWSYQTNERVGSSPAVVDGKVYIGSYDDRVYALDAEYGAHIWNYTTGGDIYSSPAVVDGKVFVGSKDSKVYCLNATNGSLIWNYTTGNEVRSSPAVANGIVYIGSNDRRLYALNATTGQQIWNYTTSSYVSSSPAVVDGIVYVGSQISFGQGAVFALDSLTGILIWNFILPDTPTNVDSSPAVADGIVYVGSRGPVNDGVVYALNATNGHYLWRFYLIEEQIPSSPAIAYGKVYVGTAGSNCDGKVYCLNATNGEHIWNHTTGNEDMAGGTPAVADGVVYVGAGMPCPSFHGKIYALNATTGNLIWDYITSGGIWSSPAIADGKVYIGSGNWRVYAFGPPIYDVAVTDVNPSKAVVCQGLTLNLSVIVANEGTTPEIFNVSLYADTIVIDTRNISLNQGDSTKMGYVWNTTGIVKGNYTLKAVADIVPGETDIADNNLTDGWVMVTMIGDITGPDGWPDGKCDMRDIGLVANGFGANCITDEANPKYGEYRHPTPCGTCPHSPNCDVIYDLKIDMKDIGLVARHFGETDP